MLDDDLQALLAAGDQVHALGAGLQLVDVTLRIAATPSPTAHSRQCKTEFFDRYFPAIVGSFSHQHVARIAKAAVAMELALAAHEPHVRQ